MEEEFDREAYIDERLQGEIEEAGVLITEIRLYIKDYLISNKSYLDSDISADYMFDIKLPELTSSVRMDFLLSVEEIPFALLMCVPVFVDSRQRHVLSAARVAGGETPIPFAAITNGVDIILMESSTGRTLTEGIENFPSKTEALKLLKESACEKPDPARLEREKRIVLAFEVIPPSIQEG